MVWPLVIYDLVKHVIFVPFGFFVLRIFESENYKWTTTAAVGMLVCPVVVRSDSHAIRITNTFLPYFLGPRSLRPKTQCADSEEIPKRTINDTILLQYGRIDESFYPD